MKDAVQIGQKATLLRRKGYSYRDISKELKVSKTLVANLLKNVKLTEDEKLILNKSLLNKMSRARLNASISLRSRKIFKEKKAFEMAEEDFKKFIKDPLFSTGNSLYWAKGSIIGSNIQFSCSRLEMMKIILLWLEKYLNISRKDIKFRLFMDFLEKNEENKHFWVKTLGIPTTNFSKTVYQKSGKSSKKTREYKGSIAFNFSNIETMRKIIAWQKLMIGYHS